MRSGRRAPLGAARALFALVLSALATCGGGQSVVVVTVGGGIAGARQLAAHFVNGTALSDRLYPASPAATDLVFPTSFSATFSDARSGSLVVTVTALDASGSSLGSGSAAGSIEPDHELDLTVTIAACSNDACGLADAGMRIDQSISPCAASGSDGTSCGPASACSSGSLCQSGICLPQPISDGTVCGSAPDVCHDAPVCAGGACQSPATKADGTVCGSAPNNCYDAPVCSSGACGSPTQKPNGTVCNPASDGCHTNGTCSGGVCGGQGTRPDGYNWTSTYLARCCSGSPVYVDTDANCGACGIGCGGRGCVNVGGAWQCNCTSSSLCWSRCCSTSAGVPYVCVPSTCGFPASCITCPGNATCTTGSPHDYCHY